MQKIILVLTIIALCLGLLIPTTVLAANTSVKLNGPEVVRVGDTITLSFELSGSGLYGASGTLSYNSDQVTLKETKQKISSPWMVEFNGNNFVAYDNNLSSPINGKKTLFTVSFKVKSVEPGTQIKISYTDVRASAGNADDVIGTVTYSVTVAQPMSKNNDLASLTVSNATISPAFSAGTTTYTANVPFEVSKLDVKATAADDKATVKVNSPNLTPDGITKVTVTVTAENGDKKTYTITVKREKDPNYVASSNNDLSGITVEGFLLSPVFDKDTTSYIIWLPYETAQVQVNGIAADSKASVQVEGGNDLVAGQDNVIKVICIAENGDKKEYTVIAKRAAAHGAEDTSTQAPTQAPTEAPTATPTQDQPTQAPTVEPTVDATATQPLTQETGTAAPIEQPGGIELWLVIAVGVVALGIGLTIGLLIKKKK